MHNSSLSSQCKSAKESPHRKAKRPNLHSIKPTGFEQQHRSAIGDGICEVTEFEDSKMKSLSKVLDEAEELEPAINDCVNFDLMQPDD